MPALTSSVAASENPDGTGDPRVLALCLRGLAFKGAGVTLQQIIGAVRKSNMDVGARTLEVNRAEYVVRGLGFIKDVKDLEQTAITARNGQPILIDDIATVSLARRRC